MKEIFVFGSNLSGIHGAGAARIAREHHGAIWGQGEGLQGDSYALPTKGLNITFMPYNQVKKHVHTFLKFAADHPELEFKVTRIGCGLAGFKDENIAPLFNEAPNNCSFDDEWYLHMVDGKNYWGTV